METTIAILCPTLDRADGRKALTESVEKTSSLARVMFDDREMTPTVQKWNDLADQALMDKKTKLFMMGADDMYFQTPGWDKALIDHYNSLENKIHVYILNDSRHPSKDGKPSGSPHLIFTREWILFWGYMISPMFLHWWVDVRSRKLAEANNIFTCLDAYMLVHEKSRDQGKPDLTHKRIRDWGWQYRDSYVQERTRDYFEHDRQKLERALRK